MADAPPPKEALKPLTQAPATPVASVKRFNPIVLTFILVPFISTLAFFFLPISSVPSSISKPSSLKVNLPRHVAFPGRDMISVKDKPFNPEEYEAKYGKVAKGCKAKDRSGWLGEKEIEIDIHYLDINPTAENVILFVHGWPAVWSSWRSQILDFQDTHRLIIPTLRGFGNSTAPKDIEHSTTPQDMGDDLECVLRSAGIDQSVVIVGHDWGAVVTWFAALDHPERYHAVVNAAVPYFPPSSTFVHPSEQAKQIPTLGYQTYFSDNRQLAVKEFDADPAGAIKAILFDQHSARPDGAFTSKDFFLAAWKGNIPEQRLISKEEEAYWAKAFEKSGFETSFALYAIGNRKAANALSLKRASPIVTQPSLFFAPAKDILGPMDMIMQPMKQLVPTLKIVNIQTSHWPQLEAPDQFNAEMKAFLKTVGPARKLSGTAKL